MDLISNLALGFESAITPANLLYCLVGCVLGTLVGVLPGLGPAATVAMLLPATFNLDPTGSLIMLAGIFYGASYGGSTTAILINLPGESSSVVTAIDGYQMARQGRAGLALSTAACASFFAGSVATLAIAIFAPVLGRMALKFGAPEYFSLMVLGLIASVALAHGSLIKALGMIVLGVICGLVGADKGSSALRFTFGIPELADGISVVAVAMGMFGLGEIISNLQAGVTRRSAMKAPLRDLWPRLQDLRAMAPAVLRGTTLGGLLGLLPGGGPMLSSFSAYALEKRVAKDPSQFGKGALEGVAAPEAANNAGAQMSFIPLLTLGVPANVTMALMAGAMLMQGIQPGPAVIQEQPQLFWGLIVSMWVGNLMLVMLNLPLVGLWVKLLSIPYEYLYPAIAAFCCVGVYSLNNSPFDVYVMVVFGLLGYVFKKLGAEPAPFIMGMILGPMMEEFLRRSMQLSRGDPLIFVQRPISAALLFVAAAAILIVAIPSIRKKKDIALEEG
jgi:putative tricarboxylic transport membrane protein